MPVAPSRTASLKLILGLIAVAVVVGGGLAVGWVFYTRAQKPTAATGTGSSAVQPSATTATGSATTPPAKPEGPASAKGDISSLDHVVLEEIQSSVEGEVSAVAIAVPRAVRVGEQLFSIKYEVQGSTAKAAALVARIAELEALVKQAAEAPPSNEEGVHDIEDPASNEAQLARARRDLKRSRPHFEVSSVKATAAGLIESRVKVGDKATAGSTLGVRVDPRAWVAIAGVRGAKPAANWSCVVATPDDSQTSVCKILTTEVIKGGAGGTLVTVEISASGAAWLSSLDQHPRLVLDPPR